MSDREAKASKVIPFEQERSPDDARAEGESALAVVHKVFRHWLGEEYDLATLDAMLAVAAAERLPGDPAWLLIISGSGNTKSETLQTLTALGAQVVSTITSEGALISASEKSVGRDSKNADKGKAKAKSSSATGGLLRKIGARGILVIKDVASILSSDRNVRAAVMAALREIHDGHWVRHVGSGGGRTLEWRGRIVLVGACTTAWDQAHSAIASMGDRFVLIRPSSYSGRLSGGLRAIANTGSEDRMRKELAQAVAAVISGIDPRAPYRLTDHEKTTILHVANLVTLARTAVVTDYKGEVLEAHAPEMPTRFAKQLTQIMRGAIAIGMTREDALRLVTRCARDSMPQLRLMVLLDLLTNGESRVIDMRRRLQQPRMTVDRTLQTLHVLGLLKCREEEETRGTKQVQTRHYRLADEVDVAVLQQLGQAM
jgi:predicted transcriptional regulator